ncbi:NASP-related protein sim3 [Talaromyces islandicus]|uniref:NASP-related protein sim3 n=1 Tax=Talaromyces islandicus TaxID=28573 RepID=A0A0U1LP26_TALIS|nr:NASP-related protein sim3 [Talaromyces islandicus]
MSASEETPESLQARLTDLTTRAAAKDAVKDHNAAAELYSQATEIQAELNGEMSLENVGLLYAYGKSLFNVAVSKSDVLGSKVAGEASQSEATATKPSGAESTKPGPIKSAISGPGPKTSVKSEQQPKGPLFQFTGDENFEDSDEDEDEDKAGEEEEEDDDFANAFEVLDLARILSLKKLEEIENNTTGKEKAVEIDPATKQIKERLADIYDLQAEISLEGERFDNAVSDLRAALEIKEVLLPFEDASIAECHYKLSLALEFASVTPEGNDGEEHEENKPVVVNEEMRKEAAKHMETAIESCKVRMTQEEQKLTNGEIEGEDKINAAKRKIANVKEIVKDMEQRLLDLHRPPVSINDSAQEADAMNALNGILGQIIGKSSEEKKAALEDVTKGATDLSSLVRKKGPNSKRQHDSVEEAETSKRAKTEEPTG